MVLTVLLVLATGGLVLLATLLGFYLGATTARVANVQTLAKTVEESQQVLNPLKEEELPSSTGSEEAPPLRGWETDSGEQFYVMNGDLPEDLVPESRRL